MTKEADVRTTLGVGHINARTYLGISWDNAPPIYGTVCWGHVTDVTQDNVRTFAINWSGTGTIENSGDLERVRLEDDDYMVSEIVYTGTPQRIRLTQNVYRSADTATLKYRHGASVAALLAADWELYTDSFESDGYVQVRIEN